MKMPREITAATLWVAAFALMFFGSLDTERIGHNSAFLAWGIFLGVIALVPTMLCILQWERGEREIDVDRIAEVVDALHDARQDMHSV
jgi:hypothetical protein